MDQKSIYHFNSGLVKVWQRNWLFFKKTWLVSLFWVVIEPVFYLGAIGFGLGAFVSNIQGMSYIEFFFPALLCSTAMMVSFFEGTYGSYTKLTHIKTYSTIMLTPIGPNEIIFGEILWSASKGFFGVLGVSLVAGFFGLLQDANLLIALPVLFLIALSFASFAMLMTSVARNYDSFIYSTSGIIVPMSLLSGTYFPLEQLPTALKYVAYVFPLTHGVSAVRNIIAGNFSWVIGVNIFVLLVFILVFSSIASRRIRLKLIR
ncbi:MAG: ABC transporter permease [Bdellovibrionia bacterium]